MQPEKYLTKQREVEAVQVTDENMFDVARWCGGSVTTKNGSTYIAVDSFRPQNQRQKEGHVDDWIVKQGTSFKVFLPAPFQFGFEPKRQVTIENSKDLPYMVNSTEPTPVFDELKDNLVGVPKPAFPRPEKEFGEFIEEESKGLEKPGDQYKRVD